MDDTTIKKYISVARFSKYASIDEYKENICISKHYYTSLSILEVSLRNAIDSQIKIFHGQQWLVNEAQFLQRDALEKIAHAKTKLKDRKEDITHAKLTAELTFGFWTSLFQKPYDKTMRLQTLKGIFSNLPSKNTMIVDRKLISSKLNHIRKFRNRVFHYEKIVNKAEFQNIQDEINEMLEFLHQDIVGFSKSLTDK